MTITARTQFTLAGAVGILLSGCVYAPVMQASYAFDRHPGVVMEVWWDGNTTTRLINHGNVDKCAWSDAQEGRVLHAGETWQFTQMQAPGSVGVANIRPGDPSCALARSENMPRVQ